MFHVIFELADKNILKNMLRLSRCRQCSTVCCAMHNHACQNAWCNTHTHTRTCLHIMFGMKCDIGCCVLCLRPLFKHTAFRLFVCLSVCLSIGVLACQSTVHLAAHIRLYALHCLLWFCQHMLCVCLCICVSDRLIECFRVYSQNKSHFKTELEWWRSIARLHTRTCLTAESYS